MIRPHSSDKHKNLLPRALLYRRVLILLFILALAFSVRALTANFVRAHLDDAGWFPYGIYGSFDVPAQDWLDGRSSIFWIDDPSRTDKAIYAPGYPLWLAFIYKLSGSRSPATVQNVQWVLDSHLVGVWDCGPEELPRSGRCWQRMVRSRWLIRQLVGLWLARRGCCSSRQKRKAWFGPWARARCSAFRAGCELTQCCWLSSGAQRSSFL